jgi:FkbM family methyltransferase
MNAPRHGKEPVGVHGHHVIFDKFERTLPRSDESSDTNFMGASIAHEFERDLIESNPNFNQATAQGLKASGRSTLTDTDPTFPFKDSEDYFEWIDLLTAVDRADTQFTMIEVGAGYGRWIANAAAAIKRHKSKRLRQKLIALESDKTRFEMMVRNCDNNGIAEPDRQLVRAACTPDGNALFMHVNDSYGNNVWYDPKFAAYFEGKQTDRMDFTDGIGQKFTIQKVPAIRLESLLTETIDFIDMDIQGAELDVIYSSIDAMDRFVKLIHVGCHSLPIDSRLAHIFHLHGWRPRRIFSSGAINETPYGKFQFIDGIQSWENPNFG